MGSFLFILLVFSTLNFGKQGWWWSFALIMTGIISDLASSSLIKQFIFRYRPCRDPIISDQVRLLVNYCPKVPASRLLMHATILQRQFLFF